MPTYGSVVGTKDADQAPDWASRASILTLLSSEGAAAARFLTFIMTLYLYVKGNDYNVWTCEAGPSTGLNQGGAYFCEYTKAYLRGFPEMSLVVAVLLIARDFLQTRLYYSLLKVRAVLQFQSSTMMKDKLVLFYLWCWLHGLMYMVIILVSVYCLGGGKQVAHALRQVVLDKVQGADTLAVSYQEATLMAELNVFFSLAGFFLFPSLLVLVYLWQAYDIEKKLLPLSIYFRDARNLEPEWKPSAMAELVVLDDTIAKALIETHLDKIMTAQSTGEEYDEMIRLYVKDGKKYFEQEHHPIGLLGSLWASELLLAPHVKDVSARIFRSFWIFLSLLASALFAVAIVCLVARVLREILAVNDGHKIHSQAMIAVAVYVVHILAVGIAFVKLLRSGFPFFYPSDRFLKPQAV